MSAKNAWHTVKITLFSDRGVTFIQNGRQKAYFVGIYSLNITQIILWHVFLYSYMLELRSMQWWDANDFPEHILIIEK